MEMPVIIYGAPVLRKRSLEVDRKFDSSTLAANMFETLKKQSGIGLAAPQVGLLKNFFIIDTLPLKDQKIEPLEKAFINPEIIRTGETEGYYSEGCLSIPGIFEEVKRPEKIEVRYRDIHFNPVEEVLDGIAARIFQHEYDHLQGMLFIDRLPTLRKKMLRRRLEKIRTNKNH